MKSSPFCAIMMVALCTFPAVSTAAETAGPAKLEAVDAEALAPQSITLHNALARAMRKAPPLLAAHERAHAAEAGIEQAKVIPNPEVAIDIDNIAGSGPYSGFKSAEITYSVSQTLETAGKRGNRVTVADAQHAQSHFAEDTTQLDLIRDVTTAYAAVAAAEDDVFILEDDERRAQEVYESVRAKVDAGKEPPIQETKAKVALSSASIALDRARRTLVAKRSALSALMGETSGDFTVDKSSLPTITIPDTLDYYRARIRGGADLHTMQAMVDEARSTLSLEKSNAVPDPTFTFGVRDYRDDNEQALIAGISFPIPVFNTNRAAIRRAGHELNAAMLDERGAQLSMDALVRTVYGDLISAYNETEALNTTVVPGAEEAFRIAREGYDAGKFDYMEMLDAQRTLFDTRRQMVASTFDYHRQRAMLTRMTTPHNEQHSDKKDKQHDTKAR